MSIYFKKPNGAIIQLQPQHDVNSLKERFVDLQSMIILSQTGDLGARGTTQTGAL